MAESQAVLGVRIDYDPTGAQKFTADTKKMGESAQQMGATVSKASAAVTTSTTTMAGGIRAGGAEAAAAARLHTSYGQYIASMPTRFNAFTAAATNAQGAIKQTTAATKESEAATKSSASAWQQWLIGTAAVTAGVVAANVAMKGLSSAWNLVTSSVAAAAASEKSGFALGQLIGNATLAADKLKELDELSKESGAFSSDELAKGAQQIFLLTGGTEKLIEHTKDFSALAVQSGQSLNQMITGYSQLQNSIMRGTELMTRGVGGTRVIMNALMAETGKTEDQIQIAFRNGTISIEQATKALHDYAMRTDSLSAYNRTFSGQLDLMRNRWEQVKVSFGKPIIDTLSPILASWSTKIGEVEGPASRLGDAFARAIKDIDASIQQGNFGEKIAEGLVKGLLAFDWAVAKTIWQAVFYDWPVAIAQKAAADIGSLFSTIMAAFKDLASKGAGYQAAVAYGQGLGPGALEKGQQPALPAGANIAPSEREAAAFAGEMPLKTYVQETPDRPIARIPKGGGGGGGASDWEKYKNDLSIINDYWEQYNAIQSKSTTATERNRRTLELTEKTMKQLYDPKQFEPYMGKLGQLMAKEEERLREIQDLTLKAKVGGASIGESLTLGLDKAMEAMGTWQTRMADGIEQIGSALSNDIAGGLTDILDGTKSAAQGFRDMALSIVKDIESIIVKQLVEYAIEQALQALRGGSGGGGITAVAGPMISGMGGAMFSGGYAHYPAGGYTGGGSAYAPAGVVHGGEYVFSAKAVQALGLGWLDQAHSMAKGGNVDGIGMGNGGNNHSVSNQINVTVHNHGDGQPQTRSEGGTSQQDAREFARTVEAIATRTFTKQRRWRGSLYQPRN